MARARPAAPKRAGPEPHQPLGAFGSAFGQVVFGGCCKRAIARTHRADTGCIVACDAEGAGCGACCELGPRRTTARENLDPPEHEKSGNAVACVGLLVPPAEGPYLTKEEISDGCRASRTTRPDTKTVGLKGNVEAEVLLELELDARVRRGHGRLVRSTWLRSATKSFDVPLMNLSSS